MAVGQLARELPVSRPAVSQHLRVLKEAGLVTDRANGTRRIYQVNQAGLQAIHAYLDQMWSQALTSFQAAAEQIAASDQDDQAASDQAEEEQS
jgi:DNA-binding transcriptional ArsR family regulator